MTKFWPPKSTIWACQLRSALKYTWPQPQLGGRPKNQRQEHPMVGQIWRLWFASTLPAGTCLSGSNDEGHVRCVSAKRRPAHAMSRTLPMKRISCSGADPLQFHRSHCTSTATGWAAGSLHLRGIRRSEGFPGLQAAAQPVLCG